MTKQENHHSNQQNQLKPIWFPVLTDLIYGGDLERMEAYTAKAYLAIKAYVTTTNGEFPTADWIAAKTGLSEEQVYQSFATLESLGYLAKEE